MKVVFVSSGVANKGVCPIVKSQGSSLITNGIFLDFFTINKGGLKGYLLASFQLRKFLKNKKYDIIHAHYGLCGIASLLAKRKEKLVVSFMGDDIIGSNTKNGKITISSKILAKINILLSNWFYDFVIVKSPEMLTKASKIKNIDLIPNGVNLENFKVMERKIALDFTNYEEWKNHIIWVSSPDRIEKNFKLAEQAIKYLNKSYIQLHVVSNIAHRQLPYYYNAADCLLLTSFHEGSPNVVKEAMACNCPVVSTPVGDVNNLLKNTHGNYITNYDVENVAENILKAIEFRKKYGYTNGREKLISLSLDTDSVAKKIISIYSEITKTKK